MHFNILLEEIERLLPHLTTKREAIILQLKIIENDSKLDDLKISLRKKSLQLLAKITNFNSIYTSLNTIYISNENLKDQEANCRRHYTDLTTLQTNILNCITDDSEINLYKTHNIVSPNYTHYKRYDKLKYTDLEIKYRNTEKKDIILNSSNIYEAIMKNKDYTYFKISTEHIGNVDKLYTSTMYNLFLQWNKIFIQKIDNKLYRLPSNFELTDNFFDTTHYKPNDATINDERVEVVEVYPVLITVSGASLNDKYPETVIFGGLNKSKTPKKEILGKIRCIYKVPGSRKEHVKHNGQLISVSDYKKLMKQR